MVRLSTSSIGSRGRSKLNQPRFFRGIAGRSSRGRPYAGPHASAVCYKNKSARPWGDNEKEKIQFLYNNNGGSIPLGLLRLVFGRSKQFSSERFILRAFLL